MALDLGRQGVPVLLLDDQEGIGTGSRALCFAKRTLEIADRLGAADAMLDKGVIWNIGKVFHDDKQLYEFNLAPEGNHKFQPSSTCRSRILRNSCMTPSAPPEQMARLLKFAARTA